MSASKQPVLIRFGKWDDILQRYRERKKAMDIEKIEELLSNLNAHLEQEEEVSAAALLPVIQCQLLLHIYRKLESLDSTLSEMDMDNWRRHNHY